MSVLILPLLLHPVGVLSLDEETRAPTLDPTPAKDTAARVGVVSVDPEAPRTYTRRGPKVDTNIIP